MYQICIFSLLYCSYVLVACNGHVCNLLSYSSKKRNALSMFHIQRGMESGRESGQKKERGRKEEEETQEEGELKVDEMERE